MSLAYIMLSFKEPLHIQNKTPRHHVLIFIEFGSRAASYT